MDTKEAEDFFSEIKKKQVKKLTDVGFTKEQAEVLLEMMQTKALGGGFF